MSGAGRRAPPRRVWLGLGANLGDRACALAAATRELRARGVAVDRVSSLYETAPWGAPPRGLPQPPPYLNAAVTGETALAPLELLAAAKGIEALAGRDPAAPRNAPRPLDVDILLIEGEVVSTAALAVPHPRLHERRFVLEPLAEIAGSERHPLLGRSVAELRDALAAPAGEVERVAPPGWQRRPGSGRPRAPGR